MKTPDYLSIDHYYKISGIDITTTTGMLQAIEVLMNVDQETIKNMSPDELHEMRKNLDTLMVKASPKFWPVFSHDGVEYGFQPLSKMTFGEWVDVDMAAKNWKTDIHKLMAILYRPITKHKYKNIVWQSIYNLKVWTNQQVNPFDVYEVEPYNTETLQERADKFKHLPLEIANGAMAFFLTIGLQSMKNTTTFSNPTPQEKEIMKAVDMTMEETVNLVFQPIMGGS